MKYKIFIKAILSMAFLGNSCALFAMEYVRDMPEEYEKTKKALESQKAREEAQRKTPPTAKEQADMSKLISVGYSQKEAEAIARKKTEAGGVTVEAALKARETKTDAAAKKLTEAAAGLPTPLEVREAAKKREEAKEAEAAQARYLPAAGLGLPARVPTLVAPTMPSKPLGEGVSPLTTPKLKPLTQPDAPEKESAEAIKKQTTDLIARGLSASEADFLMRMSPTDRAETIKKLEENQTLKPAQAETAVETQRHIAEPATTPKPVTQPDNEAEEATRKQTEALEQQEAKKKQAATQVAQAIDLETALKETNRQIATQEAKNKKLTQEINRLQSEIKALNKKKSSKTNEAKITALKAKLEEAQKKAISGQQKLEDINTKKSDQLKQKTVELQSLQEELDKLKVEIGDPTKVIQEQLIHMQEMAEAEKKYIASLEKIRQNPEAVIAFFEKAIKQREAALKAQSSQGMFKRVEGQAESTTAKKVRESTEAELVRIKAYVEKIKNTQSQGTPSKVDVIDGIIKEYQSSYAESTRKADELIKQRDSKETKQKSLEYQGKIATLEQRIADAFTNSYSAAREMFVEQKDSGYAKLYAQAFAAKGFALNAKLEELKKKRPQTKAIKTQINSIKKQIKSLTKDNSNKSLKEALRANFGNVTTRDHRIWLGEFVAE